MHIDSVHYYSAEAGLAIQCGLRSRAASMLPGCESRWISREPGGRVVVLQPEENHGALASWHSDLWLPY